MGNHLISWLLVFGLALQIGSGLAHAESAEQSTQNAYQNIDILPDLPFVENYPAKVFQSHNQIFSIAEDRRGMMLFGNGDGLLEFDGARFRRTNTSGTLYSMAVDQHGVIYLGLINDFGRLLSDHKGKLVFESLTAGLSESERNIGSVLNIRATCHGLYFNTNKGLVFRWIDERLEKIKIDVGWQMSQIDDHAFVYNDSGIYVLQDAQPVVLPKTQSLSSKDQALLVLPYKAQQLLIVTQRKGIFLYSLKSEHSDGAVDLDHLQELTDQRTQVLETPIAKFLRQHVLTKGIRLANGNYAFGTRQGGLVVMGPDGQRLMNFDKTNGLIDNYIRDLYQDKSGNLWVGTNNGMSYVELSSPLSRFDYGEQTGFTLIATHYRGRLFVGGFEGAFYHAGYQDLAGLSKPKLIPIKGSTPLCWEMLVHQDRLLIGGGFGLLVVEGTQVVDRLKTQEAVYSLGTSARFPKHVFVGLREGISALTLEKTAKGGTRARLFDKHQGDFAKIKGLIREIVADPEGNLWLTDLSGKILYLRFRSDQVSDFDVYAYDQRHGLPTTSYNMVHFIDDRLIVGTRSGIYTKTDQDSSQTDPASFRFALEDTFGHEPNLEGLRVHRIHKDQTGRIWISSFYSISTLTPRSDGSYKWNRLRYKKIEDSVEYMYLDENDVVWFTNTKGLYRYDQKLEPKDVQDFRALISRVSVQNGPDVFYGAHCQTDVQSGDVCKRPALKQNRDTLVNLSYEDNSLIFEFGATAYERPKLNRYSYKLEGYDKQWSDWTERTLKEYTRLKEGVYTFRVRARNIYEHAGQEASYAFRILSPWYRTLWAYAGYLILVAGLLSVGFRIYAWRLLAAKRRLEGIVKRRTAEVVKQKDEIQKQAEQIRLTNLELEKLSIVASETDNAVLIMDEKGNFEWVNKGYYRLYGLTLEELVQKRGPNLVAASQYKEISKVIDECVRERKSVQYEIASLNASEEQIWVQTTLTPILDDQDRIFKLVAIDTDISELKRAQKLALQHAHKAGMADIAINTIHNVGNLLNSASVSLEMLSESSEKSSVVSYQKANELLRQNMHRLEDFICRDARGRQLMEYYLELEKGLQEENKRIIEYSNTIAKQHSLISNVISAQGRYADGAQSMESEVRLEELIQDALTMEMESINSKTVQVKTSYGSVPAVRIQHNKLIQVLVNLIKNAVEAMEKNTSGRILKISLTQADQEILVKIEDNGHGIGQNDLKRVFNQGFSTRSKNRGYGLHDCANFVTEMDGKLIGWSAGPGQGACFEIRLPYSETTA